jgi:SAM-dependent methyltransferase
VRCRRKRYNSAFHRDNRQPTGFTHEIPRPAADRIIQDMTQKTDSAGATAMHHFDLEWGLHGIMRLVEEFDFDSVLDIGSGRGEHSRFFRHFGKEVYSINLTGDADYVGDFTQMTLDRQFDVVWCSHVLEHQRNVGVFLEKVYAAIRDGGILALTVPCHPRERMIDGHLTSWNSGLLCYNLILAGFDCRDARILQTYELNLIVEKKRALLVQNGVASPPVMTTPLADLAQFFPFPVKTTSNAEVCDVNWGERTYELPPAKFPGEIKIKSKYATLT